MSTLVTSGNIGDHVARLLTEKGVAVRLLAADDFRDSESLAVAFRGVKKFFSVSPFVESLAQLGIRSIEAAKRAGVHYIVRSSVMGAAEDAAIVVGRLHGQVEAELRRSGIPHTVVQPNAFMQNYLAQAASVKAEDAFYLPEGDGAMSLIDVRDIAAVAVAALTESSHEGKRYVLTGDEALSNREVAEKFSQALGRTIRYVDVTDEQAGESMRSGGMAEWTVHAMIEFTQIVRAGYAAVISPDVETVLGRKPFLFDQFLQDNLVEFNNSPVKSHTQLT
jgi:uncharacterized protein YbjT (DUF2867 family)